MIKALPSPIEEEAREIFKRATKKLGDFSDVTSIAVVWTQKNGTICQHWRAHDKNKLIGALEVVQHFMMESYYEDEDERQ